MVATLNRCALITGSGRNIGRAIAFDLAARGYAIAVNGSSDKATCQSVADEITAAGGSAIVARWLTRACAPGMIEKGNSGGRLGTPEDIAFAVCYLVSDEGGFMNGQLLQINGGVVVYKSRCTVFC